MQITTNIPSHGNGQIQNPDAVPSQGRADLQQNGELSLANAAKGSVFQGNVIDIRGNQVQIQVGNAVLNALLENSVNVNIPGKRKYRDKSVIKTISEFIPVREPDSCKESGRGITACNRTQYAGSEKHDEHGNVHRSGEHDGDGENSSSVSGYSGRNSCFHEEF